MASHASRKEAAPAFSTGVNPLFDSQRSMSLSDGGGGDGRKSRVRPGEAKIAKKRTAAVTGGGGATRARAGAAAAARQRSSDSTRRKRTVSPQSTVTTSTTQSDGSRRPAAAATARQPSTRAPGPPSSKKGYSRSAPASRNGSINKGSGGGGGGKEEFVPAPLVPALLAPVPPPPSKRKSATDIETGEVGSVLEDAPDKTIMEMLQTYLKKQDLYTRIVLVVVLLVLAGGVMGAYAVMLWYAISRQNIRYIVVVTVFSLVLFWVLWKVRNTHMEGRGESAPPRANFARPPKIPVVFLSAVVVWHAYPAAAQRSRDFTILERHGQCVCR